jgi:hypothetical protein
MVYTTTQLTNHLYMIAIQYYVIIYYMFQYKKPNVNSEIIIIHQVYPQIVYPERFDNNQNKI